MRQIKLVFILLSASLLVIGCAKKSDVAVIVVGSLSAENADRAILNLNSAQQKS